MAIEAEVRISRVRFVIGSRPYIREITAFAVRCG